MVFSHAQVSDYNLPSQIELGGATLGVKVRMVAIGRDPTAGQWMISSGQVSSRSPTLLRLEIPGQCFGTSRFEPLPEFGET